MKFISVFPIMDRYFWRNPKGRPGKNRPLTWGATFWLCDLLGQAEAEISFSNKPFRGSRKLTLIAVNGGHPLCAYYQSYAYCGDIPVCRRELRRFFGRIPKTIYFRIKQK